MALSEIEKLERRYAENPQGLTFAPLAEVHRKNGDVNRALELLRPGLQLHPDYIPASIVLGRCHLNVGDLPAAETAFTHVLALDGENVIALKALADINERLHHFDQAERWLHDLLSIDRSNDEARDQLSRIQAARAVASEAAARSAVSEPVAPVTEPEAAVEPSAAVEPEPVAEREPVAEATPIAESAPREQPPAWVSGAGTAEGAEAVPTGLEDLEYTDLGAAVNEPPPEGLQVEAVDDSIGIEEPVEPLPGLIGREVERPAPDEFMVETSEDIVLRSAGGGEFQVPDASEELFAAHRPTDPSPFGTQAASHASSPELEPEPALEPEPVLEPEAALEPEMIAEPEPTAESEQVAEPQAVVQPEPIAEPEPMAEPEVIAAPEAIAEPEPERLEVEAYQEPAAAAEAVPAVAEEAPPPPAAIRRPVTVDATKGESVGRFFQRMLSSRLAAGGSPPAPAAPITTQARPDPGGAPTRPAADALSLSSVFGDDTSAHPPAVPASGAAAAGVSFDEFYSPPGAAQGARAPRTPDAKSDDLDQFHAWLQNLKR